MREFAMRHVSALVVAVFILQASAASYPTGQEKIYNGQEAAVGEFPFLVSIATKGGDHFCAGTILHDRFILTAAHCLDGMTDLDSVEIRVGCHKRQVCAAAYGVQAIKPHYNFDMQTLESDIGLIQTKEVMKPWGNQTLLKAVDFEEESSASELCEGDELILAGWGSTLECGLQAAEVLMKANLQLVNNKVCAGYYEGNKFDNDLICTFSCERMGRQGDSGGPLLKMGEDVDIIQVGVVSGGSNCKRSPGVYTRVASYADWIERQIAKMQKDSDKKYNNNHLDVC